jgi:hypothetical protein
LCQQEGMACETESKKEDMAPLEQTGALRSEKPCSYHSQFHSDLRQHRLAGNEYIQNLAVSTRYIEKTLV